MHSLHLSPDHSLSLSPSWRSVSKCCHSPGKKAPHRLPRGLGGSGRKRRSRKEDARMQNVHLVSTLSPGSQRRAEGWACVLSAARSTMDVEPGRMVSATLGEIHFPAAKGEKCGRCVIHLLCSEVVNRRAARRRAWSGAQLSGLPAGAGRLGFVSLGTHGWEGSLMGSQGVGPSVKSRTPSRTKR